MTDVLHLWKADNGGRYPPQPAKARRRGLVIAGILVGVVGLGIVGILAEWLVQPFDFNVGNALPPPSRYGMNVALSPDGNTAYVTEPASDRVLVLDVRTGALLVTVPVGDTPSGLALSPDGKQLWVVNTNLSGVVDDVRGTSVSVVATDTQKVIGTIQGESGAIDVAFSPDGTKAYVTNNGFFGEGSVSVVDTSNLAVVGTLSHAGPGFTPGWNPTSVAVSPDGRQVWVSTVVNDGKFGANEPDYVYVFDATTHVQIARIAVGSGPFFMVLSRDGREAYVADKLSCDVQEIDTATYQVAATVSWPAIEGCPFGLAASPQDGVVYTATGNDSTINVGSAGNTFGLVNFGSPNAVVHNQVGTDPVTLAPSPDGTTAFVVDAARPFIYLVDPATGLIKSTLSLLTPVPRTMKGKS